MAALSIGHPDGRRAVVSPKRFAAIQSEGWVLASELPAPKKAKAKAAPIVAPAPDESIPGDQPTTPGDLPEIKEN